MLGRIWNSEAMNTFGDAGYGVIQCSKYLVSTTLKGAGFATKTVLEGVADTIKNSIKEEKSVSSNQTYDYWMTLTYEEQEEYFKNNEYLKMYKNDFYPNDRQLTAKHVQELANKLCKEFTNKYDRY